MWINSVASLLARGQEAGCVQAATVFNALASHCEFSVVIFVIAIYFLSADGVVAMTTTFLGQGLAGTPGTQGREAIYIKSWVDCIVTWRLYGLILATYKQQTQHNNANSSIHSLMSWHSFVHVWAAPYGGGLEKRLIRDDALQSCLKTWTPIAAINRDSNDHMLCCYTTLPLLSALASILSPFSLIFWFVLGQQLHCFASHWSHSTAAIFTHQIYFPS